MISILVPLKVVSEANKASHEHWRVRDKRVKDQRQAVALALLGSHCERPKLPCVVRFTRIAPRAIADADNYVSAFKAVRDEVARWIGVDDRHDDQVEYDYGKQEKGRAGFYGVRIEIVSLTPERQEWRAEARRLMARCFERVA